MFMKGVGMKKMLVVLSLAFLPLVSYAGIGKEIILFPKNVRVLNRAGGVVKTFVPSEAALKRAAKAAAMAVG